MGNLETFDKREYDNSQCQCEKPMTNADRIRNMTDEELAEFFKNHFSCAFCDVRTGTCGDDDCKEMMLQWLQAEVKEGNEDG